MSQTDPRAAAGHGLPMPDPTAADAGGHASTVVVRTDSAVGASTEQRQHAVRDHRQSLGELTRHKAREIIARYPRPRSALLPMLHLVQSEQGYVTPEGVALCAEELNLTKAEVGAVATFYTMLKRRPTGEYLVSVCTNTLCGLLGGEEIYAALGRRLGVGHDQTTADGLITLEHAECLAACDYAPVVTVNYEFYDQQDTDSALTLIKALQDGRRPNPTRGAPLVSFREMSRQLAGFFDPVLDRSAVDGPSAGEPTLAGARLAVDRGDESPSFDPDTPIPPVPVTRSQAGHKAAPRPRPEPAQAASVSRTSSDPEPAGGKTAGKVVHDKAESKAGNPAEQAGAESAGADTSQDVRSEAAPEGVGDPVGKPSAPTARRTRHRRASGAAGPDQEKQR